MATLTVGEFVRRLLSELTSYDSFIIHLYAEGDCILDAFIDLDNSITLSAENGIYKDNKGNIYEFMEVKDERELRKKIKIELLNVPFPLSPDEDEDGNVDFWYDNFNYNLPGLNPMNYRIPLW
jgi:hypothetical protein